MDGIYPVARLTGTLVRIALLALLTALVLFVARQPVEQIADRVAADPLKSWFVGFLAEMLFLPVLILTAVVLAISIVGIPLLVLIPVAIVAALVAMLVGFTAVAYHIGRLLSGQGGGVAHASVCRDVRWNSADRVAGAARTAGRYDRRPVVPGVAGCGSGLPAGIHRLDGRPGGRCARALRQAQCPATGRCCSTADDHDVKKDGRTVRQFVESAGFRDRRRESRDRSAARCTRSDWIA